VPAVHPKAVHGVTATLEAGLDLASRGRFVDAERAFATVLKHLPTNQPALGNRALVLSEMGRAAEAVAPLEQLIAASPQASDLHLNLGRVLAKLGRHEGALASLGTALQLGKQAGGGQGVPGAHQGIGHALLQLDRAAEAVLVAEAALVADPGSLGSRLTRARANMALGKLRDSADDFLGVLEGMLEAGVGSLGSGTLGIEVICTAASATVLQLKNGTENQQMHATACSDTPSCDLRGDGEKEGQEGQEAVAVRALWERMQRVLQHTVTASAGPLGPRVSHGGSAARAQVRAGSSPLHHIHHTHS